MCRNAFPFCFFLIFFLLSLTPSFSQSQWRIGFRVAPNISFNRFEIVSDEIDARRKGDFLVSLGVFGEYLFNSRYAASLGFYYAPHRVHFDTRRGNTGPYRTEKYRLQHLLFVPGFKLFTPDVFSNTQIYIHLGVPMGFRIGQQVNTSSSREKRDFFVQKTAVGDMGFLIGSGIKLNLGEQADLLVGISYTRGLFDQVVSTSHLEDGERLEIRHNRLELVVGIRL